ncbi:hypothetical protein [Dactylosporangium matsuzakiense]|uniref:Uncharacterized protein n=1 Tax=Dactylosporangium matsuzakiense TaxID=53360 RepID=A0A9W6KQK6_9ACTN|nr:hypothetical protein [Dactylosporangium matsuzakiense]GLL03714.1 hypothetical protein GCM10017581_054600 [Dactylosporangium matsuzakiense]
MHVSRTAPTGRRRPLQPTRAVGTAVVCLPAGTRPADLAAAATATLAARGLATAGVLPYFRASTRRTGRLVDCWNGLTSGGPIGCLDLDGMRASAAAGAANVWRLWHQVVAGTRPAQPFWVFADKYAADPARYPLGKAQSDYLAQPRVLAMATHNAFPGQVCPLPPATLEAFQAGFGTYVNLASLAAIPGDGFAPQSGGWLSPRSQRLADILAYLSTANAHLTQMSGDAALVAVASPACQHLPSNLQEASYP